MDKIYVLCKEKIFSILTLFVILMLSFSLTSCEVLLEKQKSSVPTVELAAQRISNILIKTISPNTGRDGGYDYNYTNIKFQREDGIEYIIVPIKFHWTAKEYMLLSSRRYCEAKGNLIIGNQNAIFEPLSWNKDLEYIGGKEWYKKDFSIRMNLLNNRIY